MKQDHTDPPDEPIEPPVGLLLGSILESLPKLTPAELSQLKEAVVDLQMEIESRTVLVGVL